MFIIIPITSFLISCHYVTSAPQRSNQEGILPFQRASPLLARITENFQGIRSAIRETQEQRLKMSETLIQNILPNGHRRPGGHRRHGNHESNVPNQRQKNQESQNSSKEGNDNKHKGTGEKTELQPATRPEQEKKATEPPSISTLRQDQEKAAEKTERQPSPHPNQDKKASEAPSTSTLRNPEEKKPADAIAPPPSQPNPPPPPPLAAEDWSDVITKSKEPPKSADEEGLKRKIIAAPCLGGVGHDGSCREAF